MPQFCAQCGAQNRDDARFCTRCATPFAQTPDQPPTPGYPPTAQPPAYQPGMQLQAAYQPPIYPPSYADQSVHQASAIGSYAGIGSRLGAMIIDHLLGGMFFFMGNLALGLLSNVGEGAPAAMGLLLGVIFYFAGLGVILYNIYLLGRDGATIGKKAMKMRVLDQTGQPLGFGRAFLRELCKIISSFLCYLGFFWAIWDPEKQTWHDKIMSTHVYRVDEA